MEGWIAELEMKCDQDLNNHHLQFSNMNEDFPCNDSFAFSSIDPWDHFEYLQTDEPFGSTRSCTDVNINMNMDTDINKNDNYEPPQQTQFNNNDDNDNNNNNDENSNKNRVEESKKGGGLNKGRPKRQRQANQVQDHIIAERRRRELLSQQFIALSAIIPGLRKRDKTSVLGEALKYLQQLKEKVENLEGVIAKHTVDSVTVLKRSQFLIDDDDDDDDDNNNNNNNNNNNSLPQIEVKVSDVEILLKVCCEKQKGILPKLFSEVEKCELTIVNTTIFPFGALALDISILAQVEIGFNKNVKELIRRLHSALQL